MAFTPSKVIRYYGTGSSNPSRKQDTKNKYVQHGRFRNIDETTPTNYVSLAVFDSFSEDFTKNSITEISISFTAAGGYHTNHAHATKTLEFYFGYTEAEARSLYGKTSPQKGVITHTFTQNPDGATFNITITDSTILSSFETAFSQKEKRTIAFYSATDYKSGDMSSTNPTKKGWSYNYAQISNLTLEVQTQPRGATIKSLSNSVTLDNDCSITIEPLSGNYTYRAYCQLGSKTTKRATSTDNTFTDNTFTIKIPQDWGSEIQTSMSGTGTAVVETLSGTQVIGTTSKNFNITVPDYPDENPFGELTCSFDIFYNSSGNSRFLIGQSKAEVSGTLQECYGAMLNEITLSYGSTTKPCSKQISDKILMPNKTTSLTITVKDSRNIQYTYSFTPDSTITAETGSAPTLKNFSVARCDTNGDYHSSGDYVRVTGELIGAGNIQIQFTDKNGKGEDELFLLTDFTPKESGSWYTTKHSFSSDKDYSLTLRAASAKYFHDSSHTSPIFTAYSVILPSTDFLLHFSDIGNSIGIGGAAEPPDSGQNGRIAMGWPVKFKDGFYLPETTDANAKYKLIESISQLGGGTSEYPKSASFESITVNGYSFVPIKIVGTLPTNNIQEGVIYFVKSST